MCFGDVVYLAETAWWALRARSWKFWTVGLWTLRERHRRGQWAPWTLGDYVILRRRRRRLRCMASAPVAPWRHYSPARGPRNRYGAA